MMIDLSELERMAEKNPHMRLRNVIHRLRSRKVAEDLKRAVRPAVGETRTITEKIMDAFHKALEGRAR